MTTTIATLQAVITADSTGFARAMDGVRAQIAGVEGQAGSMTKAMRSLGTTMTAAVTLPLVGMGAAVVRTASDFDAAMRNINSIAFLSETQLKALSDRTLEFGSSIRSGPQAAAEALYTVFSAGITDVDKAFMIMQVGAKTAEAGLANITTTVEGLTAAALTFGDASEEAMRRYSNATTTAVQLGVGSMDTFNSGIANVTGTGAVLGATFEELSAIIAYLSQRGVEFTSAGTYLNNALGKLIKPGTELNAIFKELGVSSGKELIATSGGIVNALREIYQVVGNNETVWSKLFPDVRGFKAMSPIFNMFEEDGTDAVSTFFDDFDARMAQGTSTADAWAQQMKSFSAQFDLLGSSLQGLAITIGQQVLPMFIPFIQGLTKLIGDIAKANPEILKFGALFAMVAAAVGPVLLIISALASPITLLVAGIAALGAAFATNFGGIRDLLSGLVSLIVTSVAPLIDTLRAFWEVLTGTGVNLETGTAVNDFANKFAQAVSTLVGGAAMAPVEPVKLNIPIEAGMTLWGIYYNSEWSTQLQGQMSYDEFVKQASDQIKGGDARWLQAGSVLTFTLPVDAGVAPSGMNNVATMVAPYREDFLKLKDEIQRQYDYVFAGKPLVDSQGQVQDAQSALPILAALKTVIDNVKIIIETWKDAFSVTLTNIKNGINNFLKAFEGRDFSGLQKIIGILIDLWSNISTIVSIIASKVVIYVGDIVGSVLTEAGTVIADFIEIFNAVATGNLEAVGNSINTFIVHLVEAVANIVANILGGDGAQIGPGLTAFGNGLRDALYYVVAVTQGAWRDLKLSINTGVVEFLQSLTDAMAGLNEAGLITDEQFSGFRITLNKIKVDTNATEFAKAIEAALKSGGAGVGTITIDGQDLTTSLMMGGAQTIADNMTISGKDQLLQAIQQGITSGNKDGNLNVLIPIAVAADIDLSGLDMTALSDADKTAITNALNSMAISDGNQTTMAGWTDTGKAIIDGMYAGIVENANTVTDELTTQTEAWKSSVEGVLEVNSPSKWAMRVGAFVMSGLVLAFVLGTAALAIASALMANLGVKTPISIVLSNSEGRRIGSTFVSGLTSGINDSLGAFSAATAGVSNAFTAMANVVIATGNTLADDMQRIVNTVTGQLNALKSAIQQASGLQVPAGGGNTYVPPGSGPVIDANASGGLADGWSWVGERGPELVNFNREGTVVSNRAIRDVVSGSAGGAGGTQINNIAINGVTNVDGILFELKRRGIKLA